MSSLDSLLTRHASLGPLVLRVGLGVVFLAHAYAKAFVFTFPGTEKFFAAVGFPGWMAYPVFAVELLAGLALVAGMQVRVASLALFAVMIGALRPHLGNGWMFTAQGGGWEYVAFLGVALAAQALSGPGSLAPSTAPARRLTPAATGA